MVHEREFFFDDYHGLSGIDLRSTRLVVCQGMSGRRRYVAQAPVVSS